MQKDSFCVFKNIHYIETESCFMFVKMYNNPYIPVFLAQIYMDAGHTWHTLIRKKLQKSTFQILKILSVENYETTNLKYLAL
jgi:hypothetical protein